jgi:Tfp pilus assembly protein PilX
VCATSTRGRPRGPARFPRDERGSLLVGALALLVMLAGILLAASSGVINDTDAATRHRWRTSAFYVAEAGLQYAFAQAKIDSSWAGLAAPGRNCAEGNFNVSVTRTDPAGASLPAGQKRYIATGTVYGAQAVASLTVQF